MLIEGQPLLIPTGVQRNENNATTFQPYDPLEVLGNTSPTSPTPSNVKECGTVGKIMLAIVTFAVAYWVDPYLANAVQQGLMIATGHQEEFSWEQFAAAAITAGITSNVSAGVSTYVSNATGSAIAGAAAGGAVGSAVSQGVSMALGIQEKFSWAAVAGAAAGAAAGAWAMPTARLAHIADKHGASQFASANFIRASASGVANAATRSLMNDGDFGDNMLAALPDVIGQTMAAMAGASDAPQSNASDGLERSMREALDRSLPAWTPEAEATLAQGDALVASVEALLYGDTSEPGYQTHSVVRGDRLETILRGVYGDNYRAAMPFVMADNDIQLNRYGSPMIYPNDELVLRDISGMDSATFAQATAWSGGLIANNTQGLAAFAAEQANVPFWVDVFNSKVCPTDRPMTEAESVSAWLAADRVTRTAQPMRPTPSLGQRLSAVGAALRDGGVDAIGGIVGGMVAGGQAYGDLTLGYGFDALRLAGVRLPDYAPSLIGHLSDNVQMGLALADFVRRPEVQREALVWGGLTNPLLAGWSASELTGRAHSGWQNLRADYDADPLGTTYNVVRGGTYWGLTAASVVVAPEVLAMRAPALVARAGAWVRGLPRIELEFAPQLSARVNALGGFPRVNVHGPVVFKLPANATPEIRAQAQAYVNAANEAMMRGKLSPTGRVSTRGRLGVEMDAAREREFVRAQRAGTPYKGVVGHGPDTTWTNDPEAFRWLDMDATLNQSLGAQARRYPIGYKPTIFRLNV